MRGLKALLVVLLASAVCTGCGREEQRAAPAETAVTLAANQVGEAQQRSIHPAFELTGLTEAFQSARIRPQVSARVLANHFTGGEQVEKGQLLVELDPAEYQAALAAAKAELDAARAAQTEAAGNWKRAEDLMPDGFISRLDYDSARARLDATKAAVAQAEAALQQAQLNLDRTRITAAFSGRISPPEHAVGDLVSSLSPRPLFELVQLDPMYVTVAVDQGTYNRFALLRRKLEAEGKQVPELTVGIVLAGGGEYPYPGKFQAWDHSAKAAPGMIVARGLFPNPDQILLPGQSVTVRGEAVQAVTGVFIPQQAVLQDQQGHYVLVIDGEVARRRNIEVGIRDGADWSVRQGLEAGEKLIVRGAERIAPGSRVQVAAAN